MTVQSGSCASVCVFTCIGVSPLTNHLPIIRSGSCWRSKPVRVRQNFLFIVNIRCLVRDKRLNRKHGERTRQRSHRLFRTGGPFLSHVGKKNSLRARPRAGNGRRSFHYRPVQSSTSLPSTDGKSYSKTSVLLNDIVGPRVAFPNNACGLFTRH